MRFMTLTLERIYMSGFLSISLKYEIDIILIELIDLRTHLHTHTPLDMCTKLACMSIC